MNRKLTFIILFAISFCALEIAANEHFKVPLEVREKNRPERLIDNSDDPDMRALKDIQDKFFNIVGNSSAGKEFKSFKQLLHLVDSNAGIEIGRLMFQGVMIAYGKDNSNQLLNEFIDDFHYRISPDLADAIIDYKDFLKTIDLSMIPLTLQTLFRKDELGNSLAQMPLGQLVDLVQPEASKYGIDIKGVINGILGKGDSTFPDIIKKLIDNFDTSSILKNLVQPETSESSEQSSISEEKKRQRKNPILMVFKPFISNLLKENKIDLETDAVMQVMEPFVAPLLQSFMPSTAAGKDGKQQNGNFDFTQLLPMLTLLGSQMGGSKRGDKKHEKLSESETIRSNKVEDKIKKPDSVDNAMDMLSGLLQMSENLKKGKIDDTDAGKEQDLLKLAMTLMGSMGGKGKKDDPMANILNLAAGALQMSNENGEQSKDPSANTMALLQSAMSLMGNMGNKKSDGNPLEGLLGIASAFMGKQDGTAGDPMGGLLNLASSFMDNKNGQKPDLVNIMHSLLGGPNGQEIRSMVKMAAALFGTGKNKRRNRDAAKKIDETPDLLKSRHEERMKRLEEYKASIKTDPRYLAAKKNVETVFNELKEMENNGTASEVSEDGKKVPEKETSKKEKKEKEEKEIGSEDKFERSKSFPYAFEKFASGIQSDKSIHSKIHQLFAMGRVYISSKFRTRKDFESYLTSLLLPYDNNLNVQALTAPFYLPEREFAEFLAHFTQEDLRNNKLVSLTTGEILKKMGDKKLNQDLVTVLSSQMTTLMSKFGLNDITFDNFPNMLSIIIPIVAQKQGLPDNIDTLLYPLQYSLTSMKNWYFEKVQKYSSFSEKEFQDIFVESLYNEVFLPLKHLLNIRRVSKSSKSCIPREVCEFVNKVDEDHVVETLVSQISSIIFGAYIGEREKDPQLFIDTVRASVYRGNCEKTFPITCGMKKPKKEDDDDDFQYEHIEL